MQQRCDYLCAVVDDGTQQICVDIVDIPCDGELIAI